MNEIQEALEGQANNETSSDSVESTESKSNPEVDSLKKDVSTLSHKLDAFASTTQQMLLNQQQQAPEPEPEPVDYTEDPDEYIKREVARQVEKAREKTVSEMQTQNLEQTWDSKAYKEYPDLNDKSSVFYRETYDELHSMPSKNTPDAVYNAAARVAARHDREGRSVQHNEELRSHSAANASLQGATPLSPRTGKGVPAQVSEEVLHMVGQLGYDKKTYENIIQKGNRSKPNIRG